MRGEEGKGDGRGREMGERGGGGKERGKEEARGRRG